MDQLKPSSANSSPLTPLSLLERAAVIYGDCPSVVYNNTTYTWSETHVRCLRLASSLVSMGIERGQVVSVVAPNIPAMYELHFAIPMAGAVINNINLRLDARTISILLHHSEAKLVFVDYQYTSVVLEALSLFPPDSQRPVIVLIHDVKSDSFTDEFYTTYKWFAISTDSEMNRPNHIQNGGSRYKDSSTFRIGSMMIADYFAEMGDF